MTNLEERILGEKTSYYCSSSESSDDEDKDDSEKVHYGCHSETEKKVNSISEKHCTGSSVNTGPKGVIQDWQKFKQLENEKCKEKEMRTLEMIQSLSLTCSGQKEENDADDENIEKELLDDDVFKEYVQNRMAEVFLQMNRLSKFGQLLYLKNGQEFLDAIDNVPKDITVIVHLYEDNIPSCEAMNGCLTCLAQDYVHVKFCKLKASKACVSNHFQSSGCPALLVYKSGQIIGNFVRLENEFGQDFFVSDVENFLIEHGMLTDKTLVPHVIKDNLDDQKYNE